MQQTNYRAIVLRILLAPISFLYGIGVGIRNMMYDTEILRSSKFALPVISVGNLIIGGAGKTPHIEYLIRLLNPYINVGTLSRGYARSTKGFRFVQTSDTASIAGDEPLMYARKYRDIIVAVGENRALAIPEMIKRHPSLQTILLDDAFQHRSVDPAINILLTPHDRLYTSDYLMPSGRLREWRSAAERADIVIVTKCPSDLTEEDANKIRKQLRLTSKQQSFFTEYNYHHPYNFYNPKQRIKLDDDLDAIVISAIANTRYLLSHLHQSVKSFTSMEYEDHHNFTQQDIEYITKVYGERTHHRKIILTTEKDAVRLDAHRNYFAEQKIPIFVLPVEVSFLLGGKEEFDALIKGRLSEFSS